MYKTDKHMMRERLRSQILQKTGYFNQEIILSS